MCTLPRSLLEQSRFSVLLFLCFLFYCDIMPSRVSSCSSVPPVCLSVFPFLRSPIFFPPHSTCSSSHCCVCVFSLCSPSSHSQLIPSASVFLSATLSGCPRVPACSCLNPRLCSQCFFGFYFIKLLLFLYFFIFWFGSCLLLLFRPDTFLLFVPLVWFLIFYFTFVATLFFGLVTCFWFIWIPCFLSFVRLKPALCFPYPASFVCLHVGPHLVFPTNVIGKDIVIIIGLPAKINVNMDINYIDLRGWTVVQQIDQTGRLHLEQSSSLHNIYTCMFCQFLRVWTRIFSVWIKFLLKNKNLQLLF